MARRLGVIVALCSLVVLAAVATITWSRVRASRFADVDSTLEAALDLQFYNITLDANAEDASVPFIAGEGQISWSYFIGAKAARGYTFVPDPTSAAAVNNHVHDAAARLWTERLSLVQDVDFDDNVPPSPGEWRLGWRETNHPDEYVVIATDLRPVRAGIRRFAVLLGALTLGAAVVLGSIVWWSVRRALRPVDLIRGEAERITAQRLDGRVPIPHRNDEIRRLAVSTNDLLGRLEQAHTAQRRLIADASHELRNPMAALVTQLETGLPQLLAVDDRRMATAALAGARRVNRLVDDLLVLANGDEGNLMLRRQLTDLDELVLGVAHTLRTTSLVEIDTNGVSAAAANVDPDRLAQVVTNLVANAVRAATSIVGLTVREEPIGDSQPAGSVAVIAVDDDGPGVAPAERSRIFERFVRLDQARAADSDGSGLGLAICQQLVTAHDGTITVDASPLGGARFTVRLPL